MENQDLQGNDVSLKEIFNRLFGYADELKSRIRLLIGAGILCGLVLAINSYLEPAIYKERLTFMMDDSGGAQEPAGLQALGNLFGGAKGKNNLDKILQLFESKKIIHNTLFDTVIIDNKGDYLANHILTKYTIEELVDEYKSLGFYQEDWPKRLLENPDFQFTQGDVDSFSDEENLYLRLIFEHITGNADVGIPVRLTSTLDDDSGIMVLGMESEYQDITLGVLNNIYTHLSEFFIEKSTEKHLKTYKITKAKRDSVLTTLKSAEYSLANFKDRSRKLVTVKGYLSQLQYEREVTILNVMYAAAVRQLETTDFSLKNMTPVVQVIDLPRSPIIPIIVSWKKSLVLGLFIGFILAAIFLVSRRLFLDIING